MCCSAPTLLRTNFFVVAWFLGCCVCIASHIYTAIGQRRFIYLEVEWGLWGTFSRIKIHTFCVTNSQLSKIMAWPWPFWYTLEKMLYIYNIVSLYLSFPSTCSGLNTCAYYSNVFSYILYLYICHFLFHVFMFTLFLLSLFEFYWSLAICLFSNLVLSRPTLCFTSFGFSSIYPFYQLISSNCDSVTQSVISFIVVNFSLANTSVNLQANWHYIGNLSCFQDGWPK